MYKTVSKKPDWLNSEPVKDIYSVSSCVSEDFADWINFWKHNGYWFFDHPSIIEKIAKENNISLVGMKLFFFKAYELQWTDQKWEKYSPDEAFTTNVQSPLKCTLEGFDIVTFCVQTAPECSPLSCNHMAEEIDVNSHCLLGSFAKAKQLIESDIFDDCEPGPYRIFEVYSVKNA